MKIKQSKVKRPIYIPNVTALQKHLYEIGTRIQKDASSWMFINPRVCRKITISAEISPADSITTVTYTIEENADPRIFKPEDE